MNRPLSLRPFDIAEVSWEFEGDAVRTVRRLVFILEQKIAPEVEWDGLDEEARHWLATDAEGKPVGTGRLSPSGQIGRLAVVAEHRGKGLGAALLEQILRGAARFGLQSVFLHAAEGATGFYEQAGFARSGKTFVEAGVTHVTMTRALDAPALRQDAVLQRTEPLAASIREYDVREADWVHDRRALTLIRTRVFVREQRVPAEIELDGLDADAFHWLAFDFEGIPLGTARLLRDGQIGRMAVLAEYRGRGIGAALLEMAIHKARWLGLPEAFLHAQLEAEGFYAGAGFRRRGEEFMEAGIRHVEMYLELSPLENPQADARQLRRSERMLEEARQRAAEADSGGLVLGETHRLILVRGEEECRNLSLELAQQTRLRLRIYSPWLDHALYDNAAFSDALSRLARRNRYTEIQVLIWNSHRIVKNGHALLELSRRLSSSMRIRVVHPDYRQLNHEYILADDEGLIYRQNFEQYDGYANFHDKTEVNRLGRDFLHAWETSLEDPNLRQLKI